MKGYKGFKEGSICREKQYAENTIFEEASAKICEAGIHFCENPLDVLDYYELTTSEYAEVEALDEVKTDDWKKYCTKKLKIGEKLSFPEFVKASIDFLLQNAETDTANGYGAQLAASGDHERLAASGGESQLAASGDCAQLAASGDDGDWRQAGTAQNWRQAETAHNWQQAETTRNWRQAATGRN